MYRTFTFLGLTFQTGSISYLYQYYWSFNPDNAKTLSVWAIPRSIATTKGITFVLFSSGYLDVSVLRVCSSYHYGYHAFSVVGCPIRKSTDILDICSSPLLIAACHVLLRL